MIEIHTKHADGREICHEVKEGVEFTFPDDVVAVTVYRKKRKK